ncbi:hypothetical protein CALVIDRAFT_567185 [Calocera viscosa TUFC12733]|uniref:Uncharacterized protein n=1 Tax=Calocera viscosa (strain TUFC12733) TaxID=1330018 RepID=A0A167IJ92_CALVF|nr:hypothetical protein CALVIDRAFT_567185 [Calocera viscosa TUFC12733]
MLTESAADVLPVDFNASNYFLRTLPIRAAECENEKHRPANEWKKALGNLPSTLRQESEAFFNNLLDRPWRREVVSDLLWRPLAEGKHLKTGVRYKQLKYALGDLLDWAAQGDELEHLYARHMEDKPVSGLSRAFNIPLDYFCHRAQVSDSATRSGRKYVRAVNGFADNITTMLDAVRVLTTGVVEMPPKGISAGGLHIAWMRKLELQSAGLAAFANLFHAAACLRALSEMMWEDNGMPLLPDYLQKFGSPANALRPLILCTFFGPSAILIHTPMHKDNFPVHLAAQKHQENGWNIPWSILDSDTFGGRATGQFIVRIIIQLAFNQDLEETTFLAHAAADWFRDWTVNPSL